MYDSRPSRVLLASVAALVAALLVAAAPAGAATNKCQRYTSKYFIAAQSTTSVVFSRTAKGPFSSVYGCLFSQGKLRKFTGLVGGEGEADQAIYGFQLAGRYVAYAGNDAVAAGVTSTAFVFVVDLKTGKTVLAQDAYVVPPTATNEFSYKVDAIVLRSNGMVGWLTDASINGQDNLVVRAQGKSVTVLDRGKDVRLGSLALSRDALTVFWTRGGTPRSAAMS